METKNERIRPFKPVHPGGMLKEELEAREISPAAFAKQIGIGVTDLLGILNEKAAMTQVIADKLETALGLPASMWLGIQADYEDDLEYYAKKKAEKRRVLLRKFHLPWNKVAF